MEFPTLQSLSEIKFFQSTSHPNFHRAFFNGSLDSREQIHALRAMDRQPVTVVATLPLLDDVVEEYTQTVEKAIFTVFRDSPRYTRGALLLYLLQCEKNGELSKFVRSEYSRIISSLNSHEMLVGVWFSPMMDLRDVNLGNLDLRCANFCGVDLSSTDLTDTNLSGAKYDSMTSWPWFVSFNATGYFETVRMDLDCLPPLLAVSSVTILGSLLFGMAGGKMKG